MRPESYLEEHGINVQHSDGQERRWMANERASSNVAEAANQVMNIDILTWTYTKGTGGGEIPPLVTHARAVDTRHSFSLLLRPALLSTWIQGQAKDRTLLACNDSHNYQAYKNCAKSFMARMNNELSKESGQH